MTMMRRVGSERWGRGKSVVCPREGTPLEDDLPAAGGRLDRCNRTAASGCRASASAETVMWRGRWRGRPLDVTARRGGRSPRRVQRTGERGRQSARCGGRRSRRTRPRAPLVELSRGASLVGGTCAAVRVCACANSTKPDTHRHPGGDTRTRSHRPPTYSWDRENWSAAAALRRVSTSASWMAAEMALVWWVTKSLVEHRSGPYAV